MLVWIFVVLALLALYAVYLRMRTIVRKNQEYRRKKERLKAFEESGELILDEDELPEPEDEDDKRIRFRRRW